MTPAALRERLAMPARFRWLHPLAVLAAALPVAADAQRADLSAPPYVAVIWVDVEDPPGLLRRVQPGEGRPQWLTPADFPAAAFAAKDIYIGVRMRVGANDAILDCVPRGFDNDPAYFARICGLLKQRAHFMHALTLDGSPVEGEVALTIEFTHRVPYTGPPLPRPPGIAMPGGIWKDAQPLAGQMSSGIPKGLPNRHPVAELGISVQGAVARCVVRNSTGTDAGDIALCKALRATPFAPAQGQHGDPMPQSGRVIEMTLGE
jgi:hypothetical protein